MSDNPTKNGAAERGKKELAMEELKDMDWIERGRFRRGMAFYRAKLVNISKASLVSPERLRAMAKDALNKGKKYSKPTKGR